MHSRGISYVNNILISLCPNILDTLSIDIPSARVHLRGEGVAGHVESQPFRDVTKRSDLLEMDIDGVAPGDRKEVAPGRFVTKGACVDAPVLLDDR